METVTHSRTANSDGGTVTTTDLVARTFLGAGVVPNEIRPFAAACPVLGEIADAMDAALEALAGTR